MTALALDRTGKPDRPADRMMAVLGCPWLPPARARVVAIVAFHDGAGGAKLGLRRIAREAGLAHVRNADNLLKAARADGVIYWQAGIGKAPNAYWIDYEALARARPSDALSATLDGGAPDPVVTRSDAPSDALSATKPEEPESYSGAGAAAALQAASGGACPLDGATANAELVAASGHAPSRVSGRDVPAHDDGEGESTNKQRPPFQTFAMHEAPAGRGTDTSGLQVEEDPPDPAVLRAKALDVRGGRPRSSLPRPGGRTLADIEADRLEHLADKAEARGMTG